MKDRISADPKDWIAYNQLGVFFAQSGDDDEACQAFEKAVELNSQHPSILFNLSIVYDRMGRYKDALQMAMQSLTLEPDDPPVMQQMCELFILTARMPDAAACYEKLLVLRPNDPVTRARYIYTLASADQKKKAEKAGRDGLAQFPESPHIHNAIGIVQFSTRQYKKAAASFKRALQIDGNSTAAHFNLAMANLGLNNRAEAIEQYGFIRRSQPRLAKELYDFMYRDLILVAKDKR